MPFIPNTPESLLGRSDSKNPATTCRGITSSGRPCRRPLAAASSDGPSAAPSTPPRRRANLRVDDPRDESLYCWQHKEQASMSAHSSPGPQASHTPILEARTSIDTLADRLGLLDVANKPSKRPGAAQGAPPAASSAKWDEKNKTKISAPKPKTQTLSFCCCFTVPIYEVTEEPPTRPKPRPLQQPVAKPTVATPTKPGRPQAQQQQQYLTPNHSAGRPPRSSLSGRPRRSSAASATSQTAQYMSLIPPSASPEVASRLLAELAKPVSDQDDAGYIYMFWLTPAGPDGSRSPPVDAARSLLSPPSRAAGSRRPSDVLASFAAGGGGGGPRAKTTTILLKIGRATNVQRRLNEWTRQCGYDLSLIRYYPYIPSSSSSPGHSPAVSSASVLPRKVPHSHKVERLVHIELQGLGLRVADRDKCASCGREHREWFEIAASRAAVEAVDEVIRRWVDWDEARG